MKDVPNSARFTTTSRLQRATAGRRVGMDWTLLILIAAFLGSMTVNSLAAAKFVSGFVPDWNQPYQYVAPNGPGPDPMANVANQWNAWCAPSSGANLAGHWADERGVPVADATAFPGTTVAWAAGPSWHDYQADGSANRPIPQVAIGPLPMPTTDIGWYMDTNRGIPYDVGFGTMGGYWFNNAGHTGTYLKDIHAGLQYYLNSRYSLSGSIYWRTGTRGIGYAGGIDPTGGVAQVHGTAASAFAEVVSEINTNRTLILCFRHWNLLNTAINFPVVSTNTEANFGGKYFKWGSTPSPATNAEDEVWNFYDDGSALGHAVTCVGYIPAGDADDKGPQLGLGQTDWVIVHDNWSTTPRNVIIPFNFNGTWVANTTAVPWPTAAKFVKGLVPDWDQPYRYTPASANGGPGPDPQAGVCNFWNAWCAPSSAANLAGHWTDCHGAPVADTMPFDSIPFPGSTVAWAVGASWQDYLADGLARPAPQIAPGALPGSPTDIGWYMDTNRGMGGGGGYFFNNGAHAGTYIKDMHIGLQNYLNSLFCPPGANWNTGTEGKAFAGGLNPTGGVAQIHGNAISAFGEVTFEINRDHTLIVSFKHWNVNAAAGFLPSDGTNNESAFGGSYYYFESSPGSSNAEDEDWNMEENGLGLGHAVTTVGYIPAGDVLDPGPSMFGVPTDWVIVHDNWASTPRNVVVPFDWNFWVANTIAYPDSGFLQVTGISLAGGTNAVISFTGIPGVLHHLEWESDLTTNTWSTCVSNISFCAGTMQATNTVTTGTEKRFYRIKANYRN
jgi:hypothetical protein